MDRLKLQSFRAKTFQSHFFAVLTPFLKNFIKAKTATRSLRQTFHNIKSPNVAKFLLIVQTEMEP